MKSPMAATPVVSARQVKNFPCASILKELSSETKRGPKWYQSKGLALNMWCWAFISIFFSLHPLISIKQLSATTAERIDVVY
jgi:hypothetical protein